MSLVSIFITTDHPLYSRLSPRAANGGLSGLNTSWPSKAATSKRRRSEHTNINPPSIWEIAQAARWSASRARNALVVAYFRSNSFAFCVVEAFKGVTINRRLQSSSKFLRISAYASWLISLVRTLRATVESSSTAARSETIKELSACAKSSSTCSVPVS